MSQTASPPGAPAPDVLLAGTRVWDAIEQTIDERMGRSDAAPRVFSINVPFGTAEGPLDIAAETYLLALGIDFPALINGYTLWVRPAGGTVTVVTRRLNADDSESDLLTVAGSGPLIDSTFTTADAMLPLAAGTILTFYLTASGADAAYGLFRLHLRDLRAAP